MKRLILVCLVAVSLLVPTLARAEMCTIDNVPAATVLLPYFEVDLANESGVTTIWSIANASASAAVAHVVLWSDLSVPTLDFDIYLTGYDVQVINMRDVFNGILPVTADAGSDPTDTISNQGPLSQDINFPGASGACATPITNPIGSLYVTHLRNAHTGLLSPLLGACAGQNLGDNIARGYITVDTVTQCSLLFPGDTGYFSSGVADSRNILWGDWQIIDPSQNFSFGDAMVAIEASSSAFRQSGGDYPAFIPGDYTFYGRYVAGTAIDQREPLNTHQVLRYTNGGASAQNTDLIVWRDAKTDQDPFPCGTTPDWYPLPFNEVVVFDDQENPDRPTVCRISPCPPGSTPFPAETQRVSMEDAFNPTGVNGIVFMNLNATGTSGLFNGFAQSWVVGVQSSEGRFSSATAATQLQGGCDETDYRIGGQ